MTEVKTYTISENLLNATLSYLATRPINEAGVLYSALQQLANPPKATVPPQGVSNEATKELVAQRAKKLTTKPKSDLKIVNETT